MQLSGYLTPPITGSYDFYLASDNEGMLFLSTDETPAHKVMIAREPEWNVQRDWLGLDRRDTNAPQNRSTTLFPSGIPLVAGRQYYIEALSKEHDGGNHVSVDWHVPGEPAVTNGTPPIPGVGTFVNLAGMRTNISATPLQFVNCACLDMLPQLQVTACTAVIPNMCQLYAPCLLPPAVPSTCTQTPLPGGTVGPGTYPITVTFTGGGQVQVCTVNFVVTALPNCCVDPSLLPPMVAWWTLDEGVPAASYQDIAGGNTAVIQPGPLNVPGIVQAVSPGQVAGASWFLDANAHGRAPNATALNFGTGSFSVDCWFRAFGPMGSR